MADSQPIYHITEAQVYTQAKEYAESHTIYLYGETDSESAKAYYQNQFDGYIREWLE